MQSEGLGRREEAVVRGEEEGERSIGLEALERKGGVGEVGETGGEVRLGGEVRREGEEGAGAGGTEEGAEGVKEAGHFLD